MEVNMTNEIKIIDYLDYCSKHGVMRPCRTCMQDILDNTTNNVEKALKNEHRISHRQEIVMTANTSISNAFTQEWRDGNREFESIQWPDYIQLDTFNDRGQHEQTI
jgi:hypothetical protein